MRVTASKLRENIYRILDEAIATGVPVEVVRKGTVLRIVPEKQASKLARLKKRTGFDGNPDDIIGMDWLKEWTELSPKGDRGAQPCGLPVRGSRA